MKKIFYCMLMLGAFFFTACADYSLEQISADTPNITFCDYVVLQIKKEDNRLLINKGDTICIDCNSQGVCPNPNASETFQVKSFDTKMTLRQLNATCAVCTHLFAFKKV